MEYFYPGMPDLALAETLPDSCLSETGFGQWMAGGEESISQRKSLRTETGDSMKKRYCMIVQGILLLWFFLDMTGLYFGDQCLVTRSYKEDGIFFFIYLAAMLLFIIREKLGKWLIIGWLTIWFVTQFLCHEWYTIFKGGFMGTLEGKIRCFEGTIQWLQIEGRYTPDVYHTILHILILCALAVTVIYMAKPVNM